jgi:hypothetical protein
VPEEQLRIALWGASKAGKTALLAYLKHFTEKTDWDVQQTSESFDFVNGMRKRLKDNRFPEPTAFGHTDRVVYRLVRVRDQRSATLCVEDRAGGKWLELAAEEKALLKDAQALIVLIDPAESAVSIENDVKSMIESVGLERDSAVDERPVAICVSKADGLVDAPEDFRRAVEDPEGFLFDRLSDRLRPTLKKFFTLRCPTHRFFPVSAVGVQVRHGLVRSAVLMDEQLTLRIAPIGQPLNLTEPFEWIFDAVERTRG